MTFDCSTTDDSTATSCDEASRILLVEDDPLMREFLREVLICEDYVVDEAEDGTRAAELLDSDWYDLILTDVNLPGMSGLELFRRSSEACPRTAVVLLTGQPDLGDAVASVRDGACDYLSKPVTAGKLVECVSGALERQRKKNASRLTETVDLDTTAVPAGGCRILRTLGHGNIGTVFLAEKGEQLYALKILRRIPDRGHHAKRVLRFIREGEAISRLDHHGIVKVHEYGLGPGHDTPFILMEYVEGEALMELIGTDALALDEKLSIISQVADALSVVHANGVLHRDIKPSNVLVTPERIAKITDFGIARLDDTNLLTRGRDLVGSPAYMAPESFSQALDSDHRSDIFSLGVLSYQLLTGQLPFVSRTIPGVAHAIAKHRPMAPRRIDKSLPEPVERLIGGMLQKAPEARYQNAAQVCEDVALVRSGASADALAASPASRLWGRRLWA